MKEQLTREKILNMSPGAGMDTMIAEKVMRWYITEGQYSGKRYWNDHDDYSPYSEKDFKPSTDISCAWEAQEEVMERRPVKYIAALMQVLWNDTDYIGDGAPDNMLEWKDIAELLRATPEQRCKAALLTTLEEIKSE